MGKKTEPKEGDFGSSLKFDPTFQGPLRNRSCTDVLCLLLFLVFLACWGVVGYFAFAYGDPARLLVPTDSEGYRCGIDENVKDKSYLVFFDLTKCADPSVVITGCDTSQVCVEKCPAQNFYADMYSVNPGSVISAAERDELICKYEVVKENIRTYGDMLALTRSEMCAPWYLTSTSFSGRCLPIGNLIEHNGEDIIIFPGIPLIGVNFTDIVQSTEAITALASAKEIGQMIVEDLSKSWGWILGLLGIAMVACLIFIILMRWFAGVMVWISLVGVHILLAYCIYACWAKYDAYRNAEPPNLSGMTLEQQADSLLAMKETWLAFLIIASVVLVVVFLLTVYLRTRIRIAVALIGEASKAVGSITSTLAFPLVPWAFQCLVIAWTVTLILYLAGSGREVFKVAGLGENVTCVCSSETFRDGSVCDAKLFSANDCKAVCGEGDCRFYRFVTESYVVYLHVFNVVGSFWASFFVSALGEMILASTFATWYWTYDVAFFTLTESTGRTLRYNLGTVAFGSLILATCRMIRVALELASKTLRKYDNFVAKCLLCCCKCFFWCLEKFVKFVNRNAYIMCAIHGKNFCTSAKDAFNLLIRNSVRVFVLDKVTDFLLLLGKLSITAGVCALAFFIFDKTIEIPVNGADVPTLNYSLMPVFVVAFGTYFIATIFFGVYAMAVDTIFLCFLEDGERNDGTVERPYFMSKSLRKILDKKNK